MDAKTIFYVVGGVLAVLAVVTSFAGIRDKEFPPAGPLGRVIIAIFAVLVIGSAVFAVASAREEQRERREHLAEAEHEATAEEQAPAEEPAEEQPAKDEPAGGDGEDALATHGADVFAANGCASCHALAAAGATGTIGPDLDETLAGKDSAYIEEGIVDPDATIADGFNAGIMPATFGDDISAEDLEALVAFLESAVSQS